MADSDVWRNGSVSAQPGHSATATADDGSSPAVVVRLQPWHRRFATQVCASMRLMLALCVRGALEALGVECWH